MGIDRLRIHINVSKQDHFTKAAFSGLAIAASIVQHGLLLGLAFNHAYAKSLEIGTHSLRRHPAKASRAEDAHHLVEAVARRGGYAPPCAAVHIALLSFFKTRLLYKTV